MKNKFWIVAFLAAGLTFVSFGTNSLYGQTPKAKMAMTDTMKYSCPHHPDVVSNKPGKCSKCGMDLVAMKPKAKMSKTDKMGKGGMMHDKTKMKKDTTMMKKM
jgi:hypothetical protein